jgi:hypothetical protein
VALSRADGTIDWLQQTWTIEIPQLDLRTLQPATQPTTAPAARFALLDGAAQLSAALRGSLTDGTLIWSESTMTATLHDVALHPAKFPQPITSIDGRIRLENGELIFEGVSGKYGEDFARVTIARLPLDENIKHRVKVLDLAGQIDFHPPSPMYPAKLGPVLAKLKPAGPFDVRGNFSVKRAAERPRGEWDLVVTSQFGAFALTDRDIALNHIEGEARLTRESIRIERLVAEALGGTFSCTGTIDPRRPVSYAGQATLEHADLAVVARQFAISTKPDFRMIGRANAVANIRGDHKTLDALQMDGEIVIFDGHLWQIPVIENVASETKVKKDALTAGEAAALFEVKDRRIYLRNAAISSPALGLQGGGTVGFDGALELNVVAAPLGDWERGFKKLGIPLVSDVTGAIAGGMQKVLNAATSQILYEFRITGTQSQPKIETIPAPMLSDTAAMVFEGMFKKDRKLIDTLREREKKNRAPEREGH